MTNHSSRKPNPFASEPALKAPVGPASGRPDAITIIGWVAIILGITVFVGEFSMLAVFNDLKALPPSAMVVVIAFGAVFYGLHIKGGWDLLRLRPRGRGLLVTICNIYLVMAGLLILGGLSRLLLLLTPLGQGVVVQVLLTTLFASAEYAVCGLAVYYARRTLCSEFVTRALFPGAPQAGPTAIPREPEKTGEAARGVTVVGGLYVLLGAATLVFFCLGAVRLARMLHPLVTDQSHWLPIVFAGVLGIVAGAVLAWGGWGLLKRSETARLTLIVDSGLCGCAALMLSLGDLPRALVNWDTGGAHRLLMAIAALVLALVNGLLLIRLNSPALKALMLPPRLPVPSIPRPQSPPTPPPSP